MFLIRLKNAIIIGVAAMALVLALNTLTYLNFDPGFGFLKYKANAIATGWYLPGFYMHVFAGALVLIIGFVQFNQHVRVNHKAVHRRFGYAYVAGVLFFSAPGGLIMAFFIERGPVVLISFLLQCGLWAVFTTLALVRVVNKDFGAHENWMIRSFALTLAAITLRIYIFGASWFLDLAQPGAYAIFAWLSWVPNLAVAELLIRKKITSRGNASTSRKSIVIE